MTTTKFDCISKSIICIFTLMIKLIYIYKFLPSSNNISANSSTKSVAGRPTFSKQKSSNNCFVAALNELVSASAFSAASTSAASTSAASASAASASASAVVVVVVAAARTLSPIERAESFEISR